MSNVNAPASWYADPDGNGGQRYWDGTAWTEHRAPPPPPPPPPQSAQFYPPYAAWGPPPWKGAQLGRPANGPGSLADPGVRLGARLLDALILIPVFGIILTVTLLIAAPHFGPIFPNIRNNSSDATVPAPGFVWIYLSVFCCFLATGFILVTYEAVATARYGRTLGKAWLHIRPVRVDGSKLSWGRAFLRPSMYWIASWLSWIGLLDVLWCLWDDRRQCVHDKIADTIVIRDVVPGPDDQLSPAARIG